MVVMASPQKHPKTGVYYLRKVIPEDLRPRFGKREFKRSLATKDPKEAKRRFIEELAEVEALIEGARSGGPQISQRKALALAGEWLRSALAADQAQRERGHFPTEEARFSDTEGHREAVYDLERERLAEDTEEGRAEPWVKEDIRQTLERCCVPLPPTDSPAYGLLVREFAGARYRLYCILQERADGKWIEHSLDAVYPCFDYAEQKKAIPAQGAGKTLHDILESWKSETQPEKRTSSEYGMSAREFGKVNGVLDIAVIGAEHIRLYKESMIKRGDLKPGTINKRLTAIKSLLGHAAKNGYIKMNPAQGMGMATKQKAGQERLSFSNEDLVKIFSTDTFKQCPIPEAGSIPKAGCEGAAIWLPLLAYYTGARLEEIGRIDIADIQEHKGVHYIEFSANAEAAILEKKFKTQARGYKIIPLHPDLIKLGILDYVSEVKKSSSRLFPALKLDSRDSVTQGFSKWWRRFRESNAGITDSRKVFHSFRHTFMRIGREIGVPGEALRAMAGHTVKNDSHINYGAWSSPRGGLYPFSPEELAQHLSKFPSIVYDTVRATRAG